MADYQVSVHWQRGDALFTDSRYSRAHVWHFDGGVEVTASSSPHVVPLPLSSAAAVDPEEAFVASLASCHMLWFLSLAAERGLCVDRYDDDAVGVLGRNGAGRLAMTEVILRPRVAFGAGKEPARGEIETLHHQAHDACFIAASVLTNVRCEPAHG